MNIFRSDKSTLERLLPVGVIHCLVLCAMLCTRGFAGDKPWREIRSSHFRVITNGSDGAGRHVAREFEQMRGVFASQFPGYRLDSAEPLLIVAPADEYTTRKLMPEVWQHGGPKLAGRYFHAWELPYALVRLDTVGSDKITQNEFAVVYYEYVHSLHTPKYALASDLAGCGVVAVLRLYPF